MKVRPIDILSDVAAVVFFLILSFAYFITPVSEGLELGGHDIAASVGQGRELTEFHERTGEYTRWTNNVFSGMPTYQISPSYKSSEVLSTIKEVFQVGTTGAVSYVFLYLLGFYLLMRAFGIRPLLATLGSVLWAFSSYFFIIIAAGHIWKVLTLCFIPPTIAGLVLCYRGHYLWGGIVTAIFSALQIFSNHLQMSYYFLFLMLFVVIAYLVDAIVRRKKISWLKATGIIILAGIIGIMANLPNLYHTYEYSKQSMRGPAELTPLPDEAAEATDGGLERDYITQWSYGIDESFTLLVPDFKGGGSSSVMDYPGVEDLDGYDEFMQYAGSTQQALQESGAQVQIPGLNRYWGEQPFTVGPVYVGALVCFLFILGLFFVRGPMKWALLFSTILSFLFAWGHNDPWFTNFCIDHLPLYNKFRTPSSALVVAEFTMPLLSILCVAQIIKYPNDLLHSLRGRIGLGVSLALTAGLCLLWALFPGAAGSCISQQDSQMLDAIGQAFGMDFAAGYRSAITSMHHAILSASAWRSLLVIVLGLGCIMIYVWTRRGEDSPVRSGLYGALLSGALLLICTVDMWSINRRYLNDQSFTDPVQLKQLQPTAADQVILKDKSDYRVLSFAEGNPFNETSNRTAYFHQSIGGYNPAKLHRFQDLIDRKVAQEMQTFAAYINDAEGDMSRVPGDSVASVLNMLNAKYIVFGSRENQVVQNPYANGNGWFVGKIDFVDDADAEMKALQTLDTKHAAVADKKFREVLDGSPLDSGRVELKSREANSISYEVSSPRGGVAVFSEVFYPGWDVLVDGKPAELGRVNYILRALRVEPGTHKVEMKYEPASVSMTETIAFLALGLILLAFVVAFVFALRTAMVKYRNSAMKS